MERYFTHFRGSSTCSTPRGLYVVVALRDPRRGPAGPFLERTLEPYRTPHRRGCAMLSECPRSSIPVRSFRKSSMLSLPSTSRGSRNWTKRSPQPIARPHGRFEPSAAERSAAIERRAGRFTGCEGTAQLGSAVRPVNSREGPAMIPRRSRRSRAVVVTRRNDRVSQKTNSRPPSRGTADQRTRRH
jgi:hypothetical protein